MPNKKISELDSNQAPTGAAIVPVSQGLVNYGVALSSLPISTAQQDALNLKAPLASPTFTGTVSGITAAMVSGVPAAQVQSNWTAASGMGAILNKPTIPAAQVQSDWTAVSGLGVIANKPTIPAAQVQSDWDAASGMGAILNKPAASLYTLPNATTSVLGGVIVGTGLSVTTTGATAGTVSANVTKSMVGLSNVDNTTDALKPVSTAQQDALNLKAPLASPALTTPTLHNPVFTGTATGAGTIPKATVGLSNVDNTTDASKAVSTAQQNALNLKANLASPTFTGTVGGLTKSMVALDQAENTTDLNKPISNATATSIALKAPKISPIFTGIVTVDGGQIAFPALQLLSSDPNTLDDYEEGSWNVTIRANVTDPTVTYNPVANYGRYVKIGKTVFISGTLALNSLSAAGSGFLYTPGLPFAASSATTGGYGGYSLGVRSGWTTTSPVAMNSPVGLARLYLYSTNFSTQLTTANLSATSYLQFAGFYNTDL